ncbi:MAG TPA: HNH endonuclease, partial [Candidatus Kryptobacter bacterium]|nr:HNH endonuclease [Candidatus Kryptobacter bacterium]
MYGKVLLLNQNYEPLTICSWKKAVILLYLGKAELIERYDGRILRSVSV